MKPFLEHLNMTSTDVDETVRFLLTAMPEFSIRGEGGGKDSPAERWVHVGTEDSYLCIESRGATEKGPHKPYFHPGMNHMGFVVSDSAELAKRMLKAGYRQGSTYLDHPHRHRYYFFDHDGNEYEFVQYFSEDPSERNEY
jgi:catechol 2,3-dioxygenase-like lactoylglutathione lyase family enzyme